MKSLARCRTLVALTAVLLLAGGALGLYAWGTKDSRDSARAQPTDGGAVETVDDLLVRVNEQAPGFGGMFLDEDGRLAVYLLDTAQLGAAEAAIAAVFGPERIPPEGVRALQGQYSVTQLKQWHDRLGDLFAVSSVTLTDLDEAKNRLRVGVEKIGEAGVVEQALIKLGIPLDAVIIEEIGPIKPLR